MKNISILIIEPSYLIRKGLATLLEDYNKNLKILTFDDNLNLCEIVNNTKISILIINESYKIQTDLEYVKKNNIKIIFLRTTNDNSVIDKPNNTILIKDDKSIIINKIETIVNQKNKKQNDNNEVLSNREKEIAKLVASGLTNKEIAEKLFISMHTVITHRKNITNKLGIKSISGLTVYAVLNKLINIHDLT